VEAHRQVILVNLLLRLEEERRGKGTQNFLSVAYLHEVEIRSCGLTPAMDTIDK